MRGNVRYNWHYSNAVTVMLLIEVIQSWRGKNLKLNDKDMNNLLERGQLVNRDASGSTM